MNTWYETNCPICRVVNWYNNSDVNDYTQPDISGFKCYSCGHSWAEDGQINDGCESEDEDDGDKLGYEVGVPAPHRKALSDDKLYAELARILRERLNPGGEWQTTIYDGAITIKKITTADKALEELKTNNGSWRLTKRQLHQYLVHNPIYYIYSGYEMVAIYLVVMNMWVDIHGKHLPQADTTTYSEVMRKAGCECWLKGIASYKYEPPPPPDDRLYSKLVETMLAFR